MHKYLIVIFVMVFVVLVLISSRVHPQKGIIRLSSRDAFDIFEKNKGKDDFVVLDIRTPDEFNAGHIDGAVLIDYYGTDFADKLNVLDKNKTYLVYCRSGNRSRSALPLFEKLGFSKVYEIEHGIKSWIKAGYTTYVK